MAGLGGFWGDLPKGGEGGQVRRWEIEVGEARLTQSPVGLQNHGMASVSAKQHGEKGIKMGTSNRPKKKGMEQDPYRKTSPRPAARKSNKHGY